ncbi:MAG: ABC transporter substrate-binding protein [Clostridia bacterium]|nr:ABC transporter substrate-binding protein [Clostridia bacterium]
MKKLLSLILAVFMLFSMTLALASCNDTDEPIRIGYMAGPTGMGMAKLIHDNGGVDGNGKYVFTKYADTTAAKADLAAGKIDVICLPTNDAAAYYNTQGKSIEVLAINCLNSLYVLTDKNTTVSSFDDLEGQTIYTCKNGTPPAVIKYLLEAHGINATVSHSYNGKEIVKPEDIAALFAANQLLSGENPPPIVVMPEPMVTSALLAIQKNGSSDISYSVDLNLADAWAEVESTPITMGCVVSSKAFIEGHSDEINTFLTEYKASVEFIGNSANIETASEYVVETGVMNAAPAAKKALSNLGDAISYIDGADMKSALEAFFGAINLSLPDNDFYYAK